VFFLAILGVTVLAAWRWIAQLPRAERTRARVVELWLLALLGIQWGFGGILGALPHIFAPDWVAAYIGWEAGSPFQLELGFASLGLSVCGALCFWLRGAFWVAPAVGKSISLYGAAFIHIQDIVRAGNLSPGNAGVVLLLDLIVPTVVLLLLLSHVRAGGLMQRV